jgi:hypothetical protein
MRQAPTRRLGIFLAVITLGLGAFLALEPRSVLGYGATSLAADGPGPWGDLTTTPIVISPPAEYIPTDAGPIALTRWAFPGVTLDALPDVLAGVGFTTADIVRLRAVARLASHEDGLSKEDGVVVAPDPAFVHAMAPAVRARLYGLLVKSSANYAQQAAYRFHGTLDDWFGSGLSSETRAMVDPLIYRDGDFLVFADLELVRGTLGKGPELQRLLKRLLRHSTMLVTLRVHDESQVDRLVEYWGRGGRKTDIRPLLESAAGDGTEHGIDIIHLLPEMARRLLYRYPKMTPGDLQQGRFANCYWTALNFFNDQPDNALMDEPVALQRLFTDYFLVQDGLQLGDIVVFSNSKREIFHMATYIADDLVLTKNGYSSRVAWSILPLDRIRGHFPAHADDWRITYYRRKDL